MSKIISIGTAVPSFRHDQTDILRFMKRVYAPGDTERRKMGILYAQSGIKNRYSVISDYSKEPGEWTFYPATENLEPFPFARRKNETVQCLCPGTIGDGYPEMSR